MRPETRNPPTSHLLDWHLLGDDVWASRVAAALEQAQAGKAWTERAKGRSIALMFFNPSLRTRTSMELAAAQMGAFSTTLVPGQETWRFAWERGKRMDGDEAEHIEEAVGVLSRYYDALAVRAFASMTDYASDRDDVQLNTFAEAAQVPVINLESGFYHPCQALADAATLTEHFDGDVAGRRFVLAWASHPKALPMAVPNSALLMAARLGLDVTVAAPESHRLDADILARAQTYAQAHGAEVTQTSDLHEAVQGAEVVYAKSWGGPLAYTDPDKEAALRQQHRDWRVTSELMQQTREAAFMHCLPVRRGVVVDEDVLLGERAIHLRQAEFRLYAQKAILEYVWGL